MERWYDHNGKSYLISFSAILENHADFLHRLIGKKGIEQQELLTSQRTRLSGVAEQANLVNAAESCSPDRLFPMPTPRNLITSVGVQLSKSTRPEI